MDVRRYIISNPTMVKNADGIVEAYKPGEHVMVMADDFDAVAKEHAAIMQSLDLAVEKAEEFRKERDALKGRLADAESLIPDPFACIWATPCAETMPKHPHRWCESCKVRAYFAKYQEAK